MPDLDDWELLLALHHHPHRRGEDHRIDAFAIVAHSTRERFLG